MVSRDVDVDLCGCGDVNINRSCLYFIAFIEEEI